LNSFVIANTDKEATIHYLASVGKYQQYLAFENFTFLFILAFLILTNVKIIFFILLCFSYENEDYPKSF
jgi:hypothetical protein